MKVLLIDIVEHESIGLFLKKDLAVEYAQGYKQVYAQLEEAQYDTLVLNVADESRLSSCFTFLEKMSNENRTEGLLVILGHDNLHQRLILFSQGVDDVVLPQCHPLELIARIKAIIKRKKFHTRTKLYFANLIINFEERRVYVWNNPISLTKKEYEILLHLIANKNKVLTKESLAGYLWSDYSDRSDTFDFLFTHLKNLRRKLQAAKAELIIKNIYGVGYQIEEK